MIKTCPNCKVRLQTKEIGVPVIEYMDETMKRQYRLWSADLIHCRECFSEFLIFADRPVIAHYEEGFESRVEIERSKRIGKSPELYEVR